MKLNDLLKRKSVTYEDVLQVTDVNNLSETERIIKVIMDTGVRIEESVREPKIALNTQTKQIHVLLEETDNEFDSVNLEDPMSIYMHDIRDSSTLNKNQEAMMLRRKSPADMEILCTSHARLVIAIAKTYSHDSVAMEDKVQEGNLGLIEAIQKYDANKGAFAPYAAWWIRQKISRCLAEQGRTIRVPVHMYQKIREYRKVEMDLYQELQRQPTVEEVAEKMEMTPAAIRKIQLSDINPSSLDQVFPWSGDENDESGPNSLMGVVADKSAVIPGEGYDSGPEREHAKELVWSLYNSYLAGRYEDDSLVVRVMELLYGLMTNDRMEPLDHHEVAKELGIENVRTVFEMESKAIAWLKHRFGKDDYIEKRFNALSRPREVINFV